MQLAETELASLPWVPPPVLPVDESRFEALARISGHDVEDAIRDLPRLRRMRRDMIYGINRFFVKGDPWLWTPLVDFQRGIIERLEAPGNKCEVLARGHAKTTLIPRALATLRSGLGLEPYTVIYSLTEDGWIGNLEALEMVATNPDFEELQWMLHYIHGPNVGRKIGNCFYWGNGAITEFKSLLGEARGANRPTAGGRPSLIILDDIIPTDAIDSESLRQKIVRRYLSMVRPMGRKGSQIVIVGTVMHSNDLIGQIMSGKIAGYSVTPLEHRRAYDPVTTQVLFPEKHSYSELMAVRDNEYVKTGNIRLWKREQLNDPSEDETHPFVKYAADVPLFEMKDVRPLLPSIDITLAVDNAHGAGQDNFVCLEYWRNEDDRRFIPDATISNTMQMADRQFEVLKYCLRRRPHRIVCQKTSESADFIESLQQFLRDHRVYITVEGVPVSTRANAKNNRIYSWLQPLYDERLTHYRKGATYTPHAQMEMGAFDMTSQSNVDDFLDTEALAAEHSKAPALSVPTFSSGNPSIDAVVQELIQEQQLVGKKNRARKRQKSGKITTGGRFPKWQ